ncbi:50S ribosomal protein L22 [Mobiluncus curtisii]|uniref:Large ribosomal subunit protein uL22 n=1 Tax=Mobiluncus curtisii TaxID=2051 RepID=A0A7Y0YBI0_9ACTO|nr:50S ribosomal protein L22 [Mobiluncus curtisii]EFL93152.1 ribosomal protein L22 [Mobiluncus curtisii subsp. curtisii ATCC 35241]MCU9986844.1 50S ribosomal protein L22 [Mobiluncus curtisii]MCU9999744.1 50S ribosomal protein L22 [Mobiluncus curtisii]MCV0019918.1 50S ribosomal protein L22 [Mobiluncus curtisii]NMW44143.1 50S ribosomal protein L22 [Mobiluncus curtisii]
MKAIAHTRYVRVTPQKARRIMNEVRGMEANKALDLLKFAPQKPALPIRKTLVSALANAEQAARNAGTSFNSDEMYVVEAYVNDGPTMKRFRARAQGRGARILKRTSHLTIVVGDAEDKKELAAPYLPSQRRPEADRISASAAKKAAAEAVTKKAAKPVETPEESTPKTDSAAKKAPAKKSAATKSTTKSSTSKSATSKAATTKSAKAKSSSSKSTATKSATTKKPAAKSTEKGAE